MGSLFNFLSHQRPLHGAANSVRLLVGAKGGLLIGYGPSLKELGRQAAGYVDRILNGAQAGDLPFQGPTRFDFAINMTTAKVLGLTIAPSLLVGADEIIE
jgi:putative tryptophan/tyrosine transport system substrate-binding protein